MAAQVEVQPGEVGRAVAGGRLHLNPLTDSSNSNLIEIPAINQAQIIASEPNKPVPAPKPRLSAKPFAVERNATIKPILAPKPHTKPRPESTRLPGHKPEPPSNPNPLQPVASGKPIPVSSNPNRPASTSFKTSNRFSTGQTTKPIAQPFKPAPPFDPGVTNKPSPPVLAEIQKPSMSSYAKNLQAAEWSGTTQREEEKGQGAQSKGGTSIARAKSLGFLLDVGLEVEKKAQPEAPVQLRAHSRGSRARPVSAIFPDSPSKTETPAPAPRWAGRRPLSADLTSKFESVGLSLHRKSLKADAQENTTEEKSPPLKREQDNITPQRSNAAGNPLLTDQSIHKAEEMTVKETEDDDDDDDDDDNKRGVSIKSRIGLLLDTSSTPGPTGQGSDVPSPGQPSPEAESTLGVKKLIKQLTEDTTPTQSPVVKQTLKPRPLPPDLTKRFSSERSPDLASLSEAADRHEIIKDPQRRAEESVFTPIDQKTFLDSKDSQEQLRKASTTEGPGAGPGAAVQTVRASLFENVVERHTVFMMDDVDSHSSPSSKRRDLEDDGSLFIATYKEPVSPSSPRQVRHAFDTVQAIEKNRAVSEIVPSAQWEDKALTLRSKRSDGSRSVAEGTHPAQGQSALLMTAEPQPRYLRVGALSKWDNLNQDQNTGLEKGMLEESQREGQERLLEQDSVAAAPKRLKMLPTEEQSKPRATYFALTGQVQEPFFLGEAGTSIGDIDDHSTRSALGGLQGKNLPMRRTPSLEEAYGKTYHAQEKVEELMTKSHLSSRDLIELEKQRLKEKKEREAAEKIRQIALEQEMLRIRELEKGKQREVDLRSVLDDQRKGEMLEAQKKRGLQKETERHMAKLKELEKEKQRSIEMEKQAQREFAQWKELDMQREAERQRQKVYEKQKRESEEKQRGLEMQKQIELEKQRLREAEEKKIKELERERQRQLEREKRREAERMQERERQRERERQKQREEERQRELDKERRLLEIQKEKQKMEEMERLKEQEIQQLLEFEKQKQKEKERQQVIELEKQRMREKKEREHAEKMKQMALEQEMLRIRELDKERERQKEMEREHQKEIEREKQRLEQERQQLVELQKQKQREKERQQLMELEKQRLREKREQEEGEKIKQMALEQEMVRIREFDKERERQKEMEREKQRVLEQQRQRDLERERQRRLDMERQEIENQRLRQREQEKEKRRIEDLEKIKEIERQQLLEFDKRRMREKMEKDNAEKMRQIAKQQEAERQRLKEKQRKEEQERWRPESAPMRPKVLDLDSVLRNEPSVKATAQRSDPANRWKEPYKPAILDIDSFTSQAQHSPAKDLFPMSGIQGLESDFGARLQYTPERDASWKVPPQTSGSFSSPVWTTGPQDPWDLRPVEMSVDNPVVDQRKHANKQGIRQDEQSRNPQRSWLDEPFNLAPFSGTEARTANTPFGLTNSSATELNWLPRELQPQESRGAVHNQRSSQGSQELNRMRSRSVSRRSAPAASSLEGNLSRVRSRSAHREQDRHSWVPQTQGGEEEEGKDSGTPVRDTDSQYGTWETGLRTDDSLTPATPSSESNLSPSPKKPATPLTPGAAASQSEADAPDGIPHSSSSESQPLAFPDTPTALLDTSVLRCRAQLGKKRAPRTRPTRAARQTAALAEEETTEDWLYRDSTEAKPERKEDDSDSEEPARGAEASPAVASQPQRVALFPGMDPSALKAQLKKRGDSDNQVDGAAAAAPSQLSRSPKSPFLPRAARVLPPAGGKENGEEDSPQWLKELKSKKRLSQYESES